MSDNNDKVKMSEHVAQTHRGKTRVGAVITGDIVSGDVVKKEEADVKEDSSGDEKA